MTKKLILILFVLLLAGCSNQEFGGDETDLPIVFNTKNGDIVLNYTDNNDGEDLIIVTDKSTYNNGLGNTDVYFTVISEADTDADVSFLFNSNEDIVFVKQYKEITEPVYTTIYTKTEVECKEATSSPVCYENLATGTSTEFVVKGVWENIELTNIEEMLGAKNSKGAKAEKKAKINIPKFKKDKDVLGASEDIYFPLYKANFKYNGEKSGEFFIEVFGDNGSYGHLDPWYNSNWTYRKKITIDNTKISDDVSSFPVYLDLSELGSDFFTNVKSDGGDIRITEADGETEVAREVVSITTGSSVGQVWFNATSISSSTDTDFYVYYGNSGASDYATTTTYGAQNVWPSKYLGVYHCEESSGVRYDSTANANNLSQTNTVNSAAGKIGNGAQLAAASNNWLQRNSNYGMTGTDNTTVSALIKYTADGESYWGILDFRTTLTADRRLTSYYFNNTTYFEGSGTTGSYAQDYGTTNYHKIDMTRGGSTSIKLYVDGDYKAGVTQGTTASSHNYFAIGNLPDTNNASAIIDEIRIYNSTETEDWLYAEYNNQISPATFYSIGAQETDGVTPATPTVTPHTPLFFN